MKGLLFINLLLFATVLNGCTASKSVAAKYKEDKAKQASGDAEGAGEEGGGEEGGGEEGGGEEGGGEEGGGETEIVGDAENGKTLLQACAGCHPASQMVDLDNRIDSARLDKAYESATHSQMEDPFVTSRADLEAALKEIEPK